MSTCQPTNTKPITKPIQYSNTQPYLHMKTQNPKPNQQSPNSATFRLLPPELQNSPRCAEQGMLMDLLETYSVVAPPLCRITVPLIVGPDPVCLNAERIQIPHALKVLLIFEEVSINGGWRVFAGRIGRLPTVGIEGGRRGGRCSGTRARSVRLAISSCPLPQLRLVPSTFPLEHPRRLRLRSTLTLFLALDLGRNQRNTVDWVGMRTTTIIVHPCTPGADFTGMTRLPAAGLAARHTWVVAGIAKIALCSMGGDRFELGVYHRSTGRSNNRSARACFLRRSLRPGNTVSLSTIQLGRTMRRWASRTLKAFLDWRGWRRTNGARFLACCWYLVYWIQSENQNQNQPCHTCSRKEAPAVLVVVVAVAVPLASKQSMNQESPVLSVAGVEALLCSV